MNVSTASSAYRAAPQVRQPDAARIQKDNAAIATAQRARDNTAAQRAVAELRRDDRPAAADNRTEAPRRERVGSSLNVKA